MIDVLTRRACAIPLKQKTAEETYQGLHKAYDFISRGKVPFVLTTDNGKEFFKVKTENIIHRTANVGDHRSLGLIDRFSKTIKNIVAKHMTRQQTNKWIDKVEPIINAYNNTPHSALNGMTPNEASKNLDKAVSYCRD